MRRTFRIERGTHKVWCAALPRDFRAEFWGILGASEFVWCSAAGYRRWFMLKPCGVKETTVGGRLGPRLYAVHRGSWAWQRVVSYADVGKQPRFRLRGYCCSAAADFVEACERGGSFRRTKRSIFLLRACQLADKLSADCCDYTERAFLRTVGRQCSGSQRDGFVTWLSFVRSRRKWLPLTKTLFFGV